VKLVLVGWGNILLIVTIQEFMIEILLLNAFLVELQNFKDRSFCG